MRAQRLQLIRQIRGFSLIEIVVAIAIIAMISASITIAVVHYKTMAEVKLTTANAETIRAGVKSWWIEHDAATCPTITHLVADGALDRGKVDRDAWRGSWQLSCAENDVTVVSAGPDKQLGTEDDIRVPPS
jgi:prepilin-type N-terminal cleavage/methylation domain-containing protein